MSTKEKVVSLESALLNSEVDLSKETPRVLEKEEGLSEAATAWSTQEKGIRAVLESRAMDLRHRILFTCDPVEIVPLRERLKEVADIIALFKACQPAAERLEETKEKERIAQEEKENSEESSDDNLDI